MGVSGKPDDDDGFTALAQLESPRKRLRLARFHRFILMGCDRSPRRRHLRALRHFYGLRSGRHRSLLARMPTPKPRKKLRPRGPAGVKRSASRGRGKKWILILLVALLLIPAMQVAVV